MGVNFKGAGCNEDLYHFQANGADVHFNIWQ